MAYLCVNIDHVATVRQARRIAEPDPVTAAQICELAGAKGITAHLREDRRHMQDRDIHLLRQVCKTPFNLEMAATDAMVALALEVKPEQVTLVPEKREEVTTEGGLDVAGQHERMKEITARLKAAGIQVSMFIDPSADQWQASAEVGAPVVEFHTGEYANAHLAHDEAATERELERLQTASAEAQEAGILVNAGHGLNYRNVQSVAAIPGMRELNIGHALIAHSVFVGLERAVQEMITLIETA